VRSIPCGQHKGLLENVLGVCREIGGHKDVVDFHWCSFYRSGYQTSCLGFGTRQMGVTDMPSTHTGHFSPIARYTARQSSVDGKP